MKVLFQKCILIACVVSLCEQGFSQNKINWSEFDKSIFAKAKSENKLVFLDLRANWCHWCHVMDDSTFTDKKVIDFLNTHFIAAEADQDARPDLSARYMEYGWPALIFYNSDGTELVKHAGYMDPREFPELLQQLVKDPRPEESENKNSSNTDTVYFSREGKPKLIKWFRESLDTVLGGCDFAQHYIDFDTYEYAMHHVKQDTSLNSWLKITVYNSVKGLQDPVWGGISQYSTHYNWDNQHYEKLLSIQARYMLMYTWYYKMYNDKNLLNAVEKIASYCDRFLLSNENVFYNSQDADLVKGVKATEYYALDEASRIKQGIPSVDKHVFTFENAQYAKALLVLGTASGNEKYIQKADKIIQFLIDQRMNTDGSFRHENKESGISLADNISVARLLLYRHRFSENEKQDSVLAHTITFISNHFLLSDGSYFSYIGDNGLQPQPVLSENIELCRIFNLYANTFNKPEYKTKALYIKQWITSSENLNKIEATEPGILTLAEETEKEPLTATFLRFSMTDNTTKILSETLSYPDFYFVNKTFSSANIPDSKKKCSRALILMFCFSAQAVIAALLFMTEMQYISFSMTGKDNK